MNTLTRSQGAVSAVINVPRIHVRGGFGFSFSVLAHGLGGGRGKLESRLLPAGAPSPLTGFSPLRAGPPRALETKRAQSLRSFLCIFKLQRKGTNPPHVHSLRARLCFGRKRPRAGSEQRAARLRVASPGPLAPALPGAGSAHRTLSPRAVLDWCPRAAFLPGSGSRQPPQAPGNMTHLGNPWGQKRPRGAPGPGDHLPKVSKGFSTL